jgi:hypothetical protein
MIQVTKLRCDRCETNSTFDPRKQFLRQTGWVRVEHDLQTYDICPSCWQFIADHAGLKPKDET